MNATWPKRIEKWPISFQIIGLTYHLALRVKCLSLMVAFILETEKEKKEKFDRHGEFDLINIFVNKWGLS